MNSCKHCVPGDSSRDLFDPLVGGHLTFEGFMDHHTKKGTKNCQVVVVG